MRVCGVWGVVLGQVVLRGGREGAAGKEREGERLLLLREWGLGVAGCWRVFGLVLGTVPVQGGGAEWVC